MRHSVLPLLLSAVVLAPALATAAVPAATASTSVLAASALSLADRSQVYDQAFGLHRAVSSGAQASVNLGADADGVPFIAFNASAGGRNYVDLTSVLYYFWRVEGAAAGNELVPVTITTLGHFNVEVTADALNPNLRVGASANSLGVVLSNTFDWFGTRGFVQQTYGLTAGNRFQPGTTRVSFIDPPQSAPGGSVTASGAASFSETFTVMVQPNYTNRVAMQVGGGVYGLVNSADPVYSWSMSSYIDPVITIDPAYASRFSVIQSDIPMVPVPEVSTWALMLAGLGLLAGIALRRRRAA